MKKLTSKEPKRSSLILTATSGVVLGLLLGVWILLSRPVKVVAQQPEAAVLEEPGDYTAFFTPGRVAGGESQNLRNGLIRIERRTPGPISFSEDEVNYFFGQFKRAEPAESEGEAAPEEATRMEQFNLRIEGDRMQASVKIVVDPKGDRFEMLVWADIGFENTDAGPELVVKSVRVNSLPIPAPGGLLTSLIESKLAEVEWPDSYLEMWQNIRSIQLESGKLITEIGLRRA